MMTSFQWYPFLADFYYIALAVLAVLTIALAFWKKMPDTAWRGAFLLLLVFLLLNPVFMEEERSALPDKLVIVVDESASQRIGGRDRVAEQVVESLKLKAEKIPGLETIVMRASAAGRAGKGEGTYLFSYLRDNMMGLPLSQIAGTVLVTDGQVHDVPADAGALARLAPFHAVLTGKKDEFDRKVTIVSAPKYGVLDEDIRISVRVDEFGRADRGMISLGIYQDGKLQETVPVLAGETRDFGFKVKHPGQNIFEFKIPEDKDELTVNNNNAPVIVNGIRDRLRVLLVSDAPHMGERAWRNLLKSDPAIDLVHFTILRPPTAVDPTPPHEMSLIAFPVEELFNRRLRDFDLIIFDRYQQYGLLLPHYFSNIASFIQDGGAFLMAMGTDENDMTLFRSPLGKLLPTQPRGQTQANVIKKAFSPSLTEAGTKHPVTADLLKQQKKAPWGEWFTSVDVDKERGTMLMTAADNHPLLVLDEVGEGRVAVLSSDNIWLWAKGQKTAGPYNELLRNLAHWLMKEPELEEDYIKAEASGYTITVSQRDIGPEAKIVQMTTPAGETSDVALTTEADGWMTATRTVEQNGIYRFSNSKREAFVVVGAAQNEEFTDVHTTEDKLLPLVAQTGGSMIWFAETPDIDLRMVSRNASRSGGKDWIGVSRNDAYTVDSVSSAALLPNWLFLLILLAGMIGVWWRESGIK